MKINIYLRILALDILNKSHELLTLSMSGLNLKNNIFLQLKISKYLSVWFSRVKPKAGTIFK